MIHRTKISNKKEFSTGAAEEKWNKIIGFHFAIHPTLFKIKVLKSFFTAMS